MWRTGSLGWFTGLVILVAGIAPAQSATIEQRLIEAQSAYRTNVPASAALARECRTDAERTGSMAKDTLRALHACATLDEALADCSHVVGFTARSGYRTPTGSYRPQRMYKKYFSRKYDNAPMPYSIFFHGGYAIHGTNHLKALGRPASHGCVRLHPENAAQLYSMVQRAGSGNTRIKIVR